MNQRNVNVDFERLIQDARLQRSAAIGGALVNFVIAAGSVLKRAIGGIRADQRTAKVAGTH